MLKHIQDSSDYLETGKFPCPEGQHCLDLTHRMGGLEGEIFKTLKPIKGWRQIGCVHSKQLDPDTVIEQMYCEYCNKEDHQMWMIYDYGDETWNMGVERSGLIFVELLIQHLIKRLVDRGSFTEIESIGKK